MSFERSSSKIHLLTRCVLYNRPYSNIHAVAELSEIVRT